MGNDSTRLVPRISCRTTLITPPWLNTTTVSSCSAVAATLSMAACTRARNPSSSTALGHPGPLLRVLRADLLDRDVHRQIAVVFGEAIVDLDVQPARGGDRFRGLERAPLRAAHQPGDRKSGQRIGQSRCLRMPFVGEVGVGALAGFA